MSGYLNISQVATWQSESLTILLIYNLNWGLFGPPRNFLNNHGCVITKNVITTLITNRRNYVTTLSCILKRHEYFLVLQLWSNIGHKYANYCWTLTVLHPFFPFRTELGSERQLPFLRQCIKAPAFCFGQGYNYKVSPLFVRIFLPNLS
jgi:hypothetical protein